MKRRISVFLLALCMVLSLLPATAWAEIKSGSVPAMVYYSYDTDTKVLTLSGSTYLNNANYYSNFSSFARLPVGQIEKVVINSGVTGLGNYAFKDFVSMTSISIPNTVTYIGDNAFDYCYSLESIKLPANLTYIGTYAFGRCFSLSSITIPAGVTEIGQDAFEGCDELTSVTFQGPIKTIGKSAFGGLGSLRTVTFPSRVGSSASIEKQAFSSCPSLESIVIPEGVYSIGYYAFYGCYGLRSVTFPSSLQYLDNAFTFCRALESITFTGDAPSISNGAFLDVTSTVYYPAGNPTWTADVMQNYGGNLTWVAVCTGSHSYGDWTGVDEAKHKRTCAYCDHEETADHTWDEGTVTTAPTCQATGEALFTCTGCGVTKNETLPIADHPYSPWEKVDDQTHTHACTVCGKEETVAHTWDEGTTLKAANCIADGEVKYTCTGCGLTRNETVAMTGIHTYDHGCDKDCNICAAKRTTSHKYSTDWTSGKSGHWHVCLNCGQKDTVAAHKPGPEPTEETAQTCTVCSYIIKPTLKHEHAFADALTSDESGHWYPCASCSDQKDFAAHAFDNDCDTKCGTCGYERIIEHKWDEEWRHDETGHFHACTVCGEKKDISDHDWRRGVCTVCAAEDPNYEPPTIPIVIGTAVFAAGAAAVFVWKGKKKKTAA